MSKPTDSSYGATDNITKSLQMVGTNKTSLARNLFLVFKCDLMKVCFVNGELMLDYSNNDPSRLKVNSRINAVT